MSRACLEPDMEVGVLLTEQLRVTFLAERREYFTEFTDYEINEKSADWNVYIYIYVEVVAHFNILRQRCIKLRTYGVWFIWNKIIIIFATISLIKIFGNFERKNL